MIKRTGYSMLRLAAGDVVALSDEASAIRGSALEVLEIVEASISLFGQKAAVISKIWAAFEEAGEDNWDGEGGQGMDVLSALRAADLIRALPDNFPLPEITVEPDGEISFDWIESRNRLFSLSVGTGDRLAFAWVDGSESGHGVARARGATVPSRILNEVAEITFPDSARFWIA
jgi:hypothetical protein